MELRSSASTSDLVDFTPKSEQRKHSALLDHNYRLCCGADHKGCHAR